MKRIIRASKTIALNSLFAWLAYAALANETQWCWNIVRFWLCLSCLFSAIANQADCKAELIKKGRSIPQWLDMSYDIALATWFAAYGHFFYAAMVLLMSLLQTAAFTPAKEKTA